MAGWRGTVCDKLLSSILSLSFFITIYDTSCLIWFWFSFYKSIIYIYIFYSYLFENKALSNSEPYSSSLYCNCNCWGMYFCCSLQYDGCQNTFLQFYDRADCEDVEEDDEEELYDYFRLFFCFFDFFTFYLSFFLDSYVSTY